MSRTRELAELATAYDSGTPLGFRNRIINGDMRIAQRGTAAVTADNAYPVDRINIAFDTDGAYSAQQSTTAPVGFTNSVQWTTTTADASLGSTQRALVMHNIEGFNAADLGWGAANAQAVTLSFWVRSSLTGTFGGSIANSDQNRSYPFTYTISAANTWEQKTITVPGDTTGTWATNNGLGIRVRFGMGVGSGLSGTAGVWAGSDFRSATGAVNVMGTLNATWFLTGVQLEAGSVATPFERRPYGTELALCSRYFQSFVAVGSINYWGGTGRLRFQLPVQMRAAPTFALTGTGDASGLTTLSGGSFTESFTTAGRYDNTTSALANWESASAYIPISASAEL